MVLVTFSFKRKSNTDQKKCTFVYRKLIRFEEDFYHKSDSVAFPEHFGQAVLHFWH